MPVMPNANPTNESSSHACVAAWSATGGLRRPRILVVKLTSLGDVVKALPVVDDIRCALPGATIDWAVERPCDALVALHPGIDRVIPFELRRYRKERRYGAGLGALVRDVRELRARRYDLVVDLQSRMKSVLVGAAAHGPAFGLACGPTSERHYDRLYRRAVPRDAIAGLDAVSAYRAQAAWSCGYPRPTGEANYGLREPGRMPAAPGLILPSSVAVLLHGSSGSEKCWPEERWVGLSQALHERGIRSLLPWGCPSERERAHRLAAGIPGSSVPGRVLELVDWVGVLARAGLVVGVDTGLTHLAAACAAPTVAIFRATSAAHSGIHGSVPHRNLGGEGIDVPVEQVVLAADAILAGRMPRRELDGLDHHRVLARLRARPCPSPA